MSAAFIIAAAVVGAVSCSVLGAILYLTSQAASPRVEAERYAERNGETYPFDEVGMRVPVERGEER